MRKLTKEERVSKAWALWTVDSKHLNFGAHMVEQQDARELPLVEALRWIRDRYEMSSAAHSAARDALAAYDALDAAPEPTLLEAAKGLKTRSCHTNDDEVYVLVLKSDADALKAAVERAEREGKS